MHIPIGKNTVDYDIFRSFLIQSIISSSLFKKMLKPIIAEIVLALQIHSTPVGKHKNVILFRYTQKCVAMHYSVNFALR